MRREKYHIVLDSDERNIIVRALNTLRTKQMEEGRPTDPVDNLIIQTSNAPTRRVKTIPENRHEVR